MNLHVKYVNNNYYSHFILNNNDNKDDNNGNDMRCYCSFVHAKTYSFRFFVCGCIVHV